MPMPPSARLRPGTSLATFFLFSWLHLLWLSRATLHAGLGAVGADISTLFHFSAWLFYSLLYLLPAVGITWLVAVFAGTRHNMAVYTAALATSTAVLLFARVDGMVYDLYAFHINSFILNLLFTPGGIASLGSGQESLLSFALMLAGVMALQALLLVIALRLPKLRPGRRQVLPAVLAACCLFATQGIIYGISDINNYGPVLDGAKAFPFFQRVRFRSLAARLGFEHRHRGEFSVTRGAQLRYPLEPVPFHELDSTPNIIVLVAESLRWDQLNPNTMPNTWAFSQRAWRFDNHYSSGNGTREGLFGMFYGLYGSYWESFMTAQRPPLLMQRLEALGYSFDLRTSATFTYPEFDKTLFAGFPESALHAADATLPPWQRDQRNTDALLNFISNTPAQTPFFQFLFFESTHAPYSFPERHARYPDYGGAMDYASLSRASLAANIKPIYGRYRNAAHWVDTQLGRIYAKLDQNGLLANTIVIVTGDHGEEFMEKGAWGHNSSFVEEQTHVPLVMALPEQAPSVIQTPSSHLDIATTLLELLGAGGKPSHYTLGVSLLHPQSRDHLVLSDWHSIGILTPELKYRIPYLNLSGADYWAPTDIADTPLTADHAETYIARYRDLILKIIANCSKFTQRDTNTDNI